MTPDRDLGEAVLDRDRDLDRDTADDQARAAARAVAGPVPAPRPEILARVLAGLRDLPAVAAPDGDGASRADGNPGLPLPRRRS